MVRFFPNNRRFAWESKKSQDWNTVSERSASGKLRTLTNQLYPHWTIEASYPKLTDEEQRELLGFFALLKGDFEPFYWLDPEDYQVTGQQLAVDPNTPGAYPCVMVQGDYVEPVAYVDQLKIYVDGVEAQASSYTLQDGVIKFQQVPAGTVTADYRYYWKVRFAQGSLTVEKRFKNVNKASFKLEVVR